MTGSLYLQSRLHLKVYMRIDRGCQILRDFSLRHVSLDLSGALIRRQVLIAYRSCACQPRSLHASAEEHSHRQKRTLLCSSWGARPVLSARRAPFRGWSGGVVGEGRLLGLFDRVHAGGRTCSLVYRVGAGQGFIWDHGWCPRRGWQRYSTEVQQHAGTRVAAQGRGRMVTCGDGRGWTCCRQMACKGSGVRISLAPLARSVIGTDRTASTAAKYRNGGPVGRRMCVRIGQLPPAELLADQRVPDGAAALSGPSAGITPFPRSRDFCRRSPHGSCERLCLTVTVAVLAGGRRTAVRAPTPALSSGTRRPAPAGSLASGTHGLDTLRQTTPVRARRRPERCAAQAGLRP